MRLPFNICPLQRMSVKNIRNTFLILNFTPVSPQNSLNSLGHGLYKVLKAVGWMFFGWSTILDRHGKRL
jgi:hypothetical protein